MAPSGRRQGVGLLHVPVFDLRRRPWTSGQGVPTRVCDPRPLRPRRPDAIGPGSRFQVQPTPFLGNCDPTRASTAHAGGIGRPGRRQRPHAGPEYERRHLVGRGDALGRRSAGLGLVKLVRSDGVEKPIRCVKRKRPVGSLPPSKPPTGPAPPRRLGLRHGRCLSIVSQTARRGHMRRFISLASLALAAVAVLGLAGVVAAGDQMPFRGKLRGGPDRTDSAHRDDLP